MTEKHYGGASKFGASDNINKSKETVGTTLLNTKRQDKSNSSENKMKKEDVEKFEKAGKIAKETVEYAKSFIKPNMPLLEIAEKIEGKIRDLGGKPAFPINLSINEIAAHSTPSFDDKSLSSGLLKVDIGVHIDGYVADTAFSIDLENSEENKRLIESAESALKSAIKVVEKNIQISKIGKEIEKEIRAKGFQPIQNLSGHSIDLYELHSGVTIPNYDNHQLIELEEGLYAVEPFATTGLGGVKDGKPSGIFHLEKESNVRDSFAREVLSFIIDEYRTLPFCSRWIHNKFGSRGLLALRRIEEAGILHHYPQLIEKGKGKVAQAEHTILITEDKKIITTQ